MNTNHLYGGNGETETRPVPDRCPVGIVGGGMRSRRAATRGGQTEHPADDEEAGEEPHSLDSS